MLSRDQVAELLRAAEYFRSRPNARIGRDLDRRRDAEREKKRRQRAAKKAA